jgi:hypothetical protein
MKKLLLLFPLLILTIVPAASQDTKPAAEAKVAPVTTFVPMIGQQLEFSTSQIVSGTKMQLKEIVTLKTLKPKLMVHIKVEMTPKAPPSNPSAKMDKVILAEQTIPWSGLPDDVLKAILQQNKPPMQTKVIDGKSFQYIEVSLRGRTFWFVTDGKKSVFPGVLKITQKHDDHVDVVLELTKITEPKKKAQ